MKLSQVMASVEASRIAGGDADPEIRAVTCDSREVGPGALFFALRGARDDGAAYARQALEQGAAAVVAEAPIPGLAPGALVLHVRGARQAMAVAAANFHGRPASALTLLGVTGTNGKTTTTYLVEAMLAAAGEQPGVVGTVAYRFAGREEPAPHTTPESTALQALLARMRDSGTTSVVLEVSSHALAQDRVHGLSFTSAAFTNLTRDHLDYHRDMESYFAAKRRLFVELCAGPAVVNVDDPFGARLRDELAREGRTVWGFSSRGASADLFVREARLDLEGIRGTLVTPLGEAPFFSPLVGRHNLDNLLAASGLALAAGFGLQAVVRGLAAVANVPGRLERVEGRGVQAFVDYAHTPDALERALAALRPYAKGRLLCLFGCGGDRDAGKRPLMGEAAARGADLCLVTSDNPRSEDPQAIIEAIRPGLARAGASALSLEQARAGCRGYLVEPDRRRAIELACALAREGDLVLVAGKGHERYQIVGATRLPFDDREELRRALGSAPAEAPAPRAGAAGPTATFTRDEVLAATGGVPRGAVPFGFGQVSTDTRSLLPGALFVALKGERFDAHQLLDAAARAGAGAAVVRRGAPHNAPAHLPLIEVDDPLAALGQLARAHRRRFAIPLGAITGSNGKTTTKEMIGAILAARGPALKTEGNLNNEVGVPLTLLRLHPGHTAAIVEMGINHAGELARLSRVAEPVAAAITCVAPAHLAGLGTVEAVARAKGEIFQGLAANGRAVANADDPLVLAQARACGRERMTFGQAPGADVRLAAVLAHDARGLRLRLEHQGREYPIQLAFVGLHNALNAACAFAMGLCLGCTPEQCVRGLEAARPWAHRLALREGRNGVRLLDDCYNANPGSMAAALAALQALAGKSRPVAVLGDMLELGESEAALHARLGEQAAEAGVALLVAFGPRSRATYDAARARGVPALHVPDPERVDEALAFLDSELRAGDLVLLKGSRGMRLERLVEALAASPGRAD